MNKVVELSNREVEKLLPFSRKVIVSGSIRRRVAEPNDIDLVIIPKNELAKQGIVDYTLSYDEGTVGNGKKLVSYKKEGIQVQIWFATPNNLGAMLFFTTGSHNYNMWLRRLALRKGLLLNRYGLWREEELIASVTEGDIYRGLDKTYKSPELRGLSPREMREIWGVNSNTRILPEGAKRLI